MTVFLYMKSRNSQNSPQPVGMGHSAGIWLMGSASFSTGISIVNKKENKIHKKHNILVIEVSKDDLIFGVDFWRTATEYQIVFINTTRRIFPSFSN